MLINKDDFLKICPTGKLLGLDLGTKNIGIAITDDTRKIYLPSEVIKKGTNKNDWIEVKKIAESRKVKGIVIGLPMFFDGGASKITEFVIRWSEGFAEFIDLPLTYYDERLTSFEAEETMKGVGDIKKNVDSIAASYILEHFCNYIPHSNTISHF
ncbi:MAG: Holliday junction resolvase RuvX [Rickettsiales bacterium]|nr:MAG: Holliday junction resolvase RuvX [Rickettsiales bacterium]